MALEAAVRDTLFEAEALHLLAQDLAALAIVGPAIAPCMQCKGRVARLESENVALCTRLRSLEADQTVRVEQVRIA